MDDDQSYLIVFAKAHTNYFTRLLKTNETIYIREGKEKGGGICLKVTTKKGQGNAVYHQVRGNTMYHVLGDLMSTAFRVRNNPSPWGYERDIVIAVPRAWGIECTAFGWGCLIPDNKGYYNDGGIYERFIIKPSIIDFQKGSLVEASDIPNPTSE